jgi:hypothetical protein
VVAAAEAEAAAAAAATAMETAAMEAGVETPTH